MLLKKPSSNIILILSPGDCAELFDYCNQEMIEAKVKLLLQMSLVLIWGMSDHPTAQRNQLTH